MDDKYKKLLSNTAFFAVGSLGSKLILFLLIPLYTMVFTKTEFGTVELVTTAATLLVPFVTISINDAILRFGLNRDINQGEVIRNSVLIILLSTILLFFLFPILSLKTNTNIAIFIVTITFFQEIRSALLVCLKSMDMARIIAIDNILYVFFLAGTNWLFLVSLKLGIAGYFYSLMVASFISIVFQIKFAGLVDAFCNSRYNFYLLKQMIIYSFPLIANAASWWVLNFSDRFLLQYFMGVSAVGIFAVAARIPSIVTSFTSVFLQAWVISSITEYEKKQDKQFYTTVFNYTVVVLVLLSAVVLPFTQTFMRIYVSPQFFDSWVFVPSLLVSSIIGSLVIFMMTIFQATMKNYQQMVITVVGASFNVAIVFLLIPNLGIMGAAVGTLICNCFMLLLAIKVSRCYFSFPINFKVFILNLLIVGGQCFCITNDIIPNVVSCNAIFLLSYINRKEICFIFRIVKKYRYRF